MCYFTKCDQTHQHRPVVGTLRNNNETSFISGSWLDCFDMVGHKELNLLHIVILFYKHVFSYWDYVRTINWYVLFWYTQDHGHFCKIVSQISFDLKMELYENIFQIYFIKCVTRKRCDLVSISIIENSYVKICILEKVKIPDV